jgi:hypothetical protein
VESKNWINDILNSSNGITKVTPSTLLFSKIQNKINIQNTISIRWIWVAAASFIILVSLNVKMLLSNPTKASVPTETIVSSVSNCNQLY